MPTFLDYAKIYGEKSFSELTLNSIDLAIINELGYLPLGQDLFAVPEGFADLLDNNFHR